jgi:AAA domain-containing protein
MLGRMFTVCPGCGEYSEEKRIDPCGPFAICPGCGHRHRFVRLPLYIVTGPSGAGKTSSALRLARGLPDYVCLDGDLLWRPEFDTPEDDHHTFRNLCLRIAKNLAQAGRPVVLMAGGIPEQFERCTERRYFSELHYLALVCDEAELVRRLAARPAWRRTGTAAYIQRERRFNAWLRENAPKTVPPMSLLETSAISEEEAARRVADWVRSTAASQAKGTRSEV